MAPHRIHQEKRQPHPRRAQSLVQSSKPSRPHHQARWQRICHSSYEQGDVHDWSSKTAVGSQVLPETYWGPHKRFCRPGSRPRPWNGRLSLHHRRCQEIPNPDGLENSTVLPHPQDPQNGCPSPRQTYHILLWSPHRTDLGVRGLPSPPSRHQDILIPEGHDRLPEETIGSRTPPSRLYPRDSGCQLAIHQHPTWRRTGSMQTSIGHTPYTPQQPLIAYLSKLMEQILTLNNFTFNGEHYLQTNGTAMGTRMAPSYAILFMADLEEKLLAWTTERPFRWWRYIDDIFAIWDKGHEKLERFLDQINQFHHSIKFTAESSTDRVAFLIPQCSRMDTPSTQTCTQSQQTHISTFPQRVATQNTAPPRFPTARA